MMPKTPGTGPYAVAHHTPDSDSVKFIRRFRKAEDARAMCTALNDQLRAANPHPPRGKLDFYFVETAGDSRLPWQPSSRHQGEA